MRRLTFFFCLQEDVIVIQKALSKEQIDEVVRLSREIRRRTKESKCGHVLISRGQYL